MFGPRRIQSTTPTTTPTTTQIGIAMPIHFFSCVQNFGSESERFCVICDFVGDGVWLDVFTGSAGADSDATADDCD